MIEITLRRSPIATTPNQKDNLRGLGLSRIGKTVFLVDTPATRGMVRKVIHLVDVCQATEKPVRTKRESQLEVLPPKGGETPSKPKAKAKKAKATKKEKVS